MSMEDLASNEDTNHRAINTQRGRILKNLLFLSLGHCLLFTAFDSLSNLQSTVNQEQGVGIASQATIYACFTLSALFLPTYFIKRFGCKTTIVFSVFSVCPYVAANIYPQWGTLIPSAVLCGLGLGPLWAARSTYVNEISFLYSTYSKGSIDVINAWFFGIYSFFHENAEIWGNVISYFVLRNPPNSTNSSMTDLSFCGADFCNHDIRVGNLHPPAEEQRFMLTAIYVGLVVLAGFVIMVTLDPLKEDGKKSPDSGLSSQLFVATFKHLKNKNQLLLLPLSFYCGLADGFYNSDYTKSYIACAWGISRVGFVTICYGIVSAIMDCSSGFLIKHLRRPPVFILAALAHLAVFLTLLMWQPSEADLPLFFVLSGVFGIGSSVWWAQIAAFYGVIFKENEEAAFSNFYFWSSLGSAIAYACGNSLCTYTKLYALIGLLLVGVAGYITVEYDADRRKVHSTDKPITEKMT